MAAASSSAMHINDQGDFATTLCREIAAIWAQMRVSPVCYYSLNMNNKEESQG